MRVYVCRDEIENNLTAIYIAWEYALKVGHNNVRLVRDGCYQMSLLEEYEAVETDYDLATKVSRSIMHKISYYAYETVFYAMLSCEESAVDDIYRFLVLGFKKGPDVMFTYTEPVVQRLLDLKRNVSNEACSFREFVRFNSINNSVYVSHIEPKSNIVSIVGNHFADRMPSEHWMIIDDGRGIAVVHPKDSDNYIRVLNDDEMAELSEISDVTDEYTVMWKTFFDAIAIKQRNNYECQRNLFPIWKRKNVTEFL